MSYMFLGMGSISSLLIYNVYLWFKSYLHYGENRPKLVGFTKVKLFFVL
jgi:hypothetical protein